MRVLATAGHVDHGKSTLVHALTGTDPDRWAEEKKRGLTIDLGFASTTLGTGQDVAFVDVPGHVRFLKNMLAGVGAVDACMFVVAATEGWKPQSEEHLRILQVLGLQRGVVVVTKAGLVDDDDLELAVLDVADRMAGTFLAGAEVVAVDALTGRGLADLRLALGRLLDRTPAALDLDRPRLWIDRSFAASGAGTVVTGTLTGGALAVGDELTLLPAATSVRVRSLQSHAASISRATPGRRLAVNLVGVGHADVERGHALVRGSQWLPTRRFDARLDVLAALDHDVSRRGAYALYAGSGEHTVKLRILGPAALAPGESGPVRIHLATSLPLVPGDRFVLRDHGRAETVGGGEVLDIAPVLPASRARPDRRVARVVQERGWVDAGDLEKMTGERVAPNVGRWVVDDDALAAATSALIDAVVDAGPTGLDLASLDDRQRALVAGLDGVRIEGGWLRSGATGDDPSSHPYVDALTESPFKPPTPEEAGVARSEVRHLLRTGHVVERDGVFFARSAINDAARIVARVLAGQPEGATAGELRTALGTSRKFALPLLNHLDAEGVTRRRGDIRIAGPRLPAAD